MKIQLLKRTVKLRIDCHLEEKTTCTTSTPTGFRGAFKVKHFASFLRKYEIRLQRNKCKL